MLAGEIAQGTGVKPQRLERSERNACAALACGSEEGIPKLAGIERRQRRLKHGRPLCSKPKCNDSKVVSRGSSPTISFLNHTIVRASRRVAARPEWTDAGKIVSLDPWGHLVGEVFAEHISAGIDIRPTIAITRARITTPELRPLLAAGTLRADGNVLLDNGEIRVTKAAIDPVWHLPGMAGRFGVAEADLRRTLFEETGGMFPELVTRPDIEVLLPPIGGTTVYFFGAVERIADPGTVPACRVHDECNGSDVFGSDICTCRPYLVHGIEVCVETAQQGGDGIIVYNRKEGRALGEVTKC